MIDQAARRFLDAHGIRGPLVVAVSGGADSTALLLALAGISIPIAVGHVNHHLRGKESDDDEAFVRELCQRISVTLCVVDGTLDPDAIRRHGVEAAARDVRHARLQEIRATVGATHIATAHQKNDQAETVLMRLVTGGGIAALRGIHPIRDDGVIRPLLEVTRVDIDAYLRERGVTPRIDRSNADPRFLRNRIRRILGDLGPDAVENLAGIADQAREQWTLLERLIDEADRSTATATETRFPSFPDDPWLRRALLHRHIRRLDPHCRDVSAADLERIAGELDTLKRISITANLELLRGGSLWILRQVPIPVGSFELVVHVGESVSLPCGRLQVLSEAKDPLRVGGPSAHSRLRTRVELPKGADATFTVRNRRPGDKFQPLGMKQEKKLKDFLIDRKIAVESRDRIPLLVWRGKIVCVAGVEVSEAFKVTGGGDLYEVAIEEESQEGVQREADRQAHREARR